MPKPIDERIAAVKARRDALGARLNALEAKAKNDARKRDARRKIIVGGAVLAAMEKDEALARLVRRVLAASVGRAQDREVLADLLPPFPASVSAVADVPQTSAA